MTDSSHPPPDDAALIAEAMARLERAVYTAPAPLDAEGVRRAFATYLGVPEDWVYYDEARGGLSVVPPHRVNIGFAWPPDDADDEERTP